MAKAHTFEPSDGELEILQVLWSCQPASVKEVHEQLSHKHLNTILVQMQRMEKKGMLTKEKRAKVQLYTAVARKEDIQDRLTDKLVDKVFSGSAMQMVMRALGAGKTSPEELKELQKWLDQQTDES
ncbi:MAG: BlaI/MecI/CopY family transcriptional regulator [Bacteroidota bacterium]